MKRKGNNVIIAICWWFANWIIDRWLRLGPIDRERRHAKRISTQRPVRARQPAAFRCSPVAPTALISTAKIFKKCRSILSIKPWASSMGWTGGHVLMTCTFFKLNIVKFKFFKKFLPDGRVVSAANWQAWGLEFDSSQSQNFFRLNQEFRTLHWLSFWIQFQFLIKLNF